MHVEEGTIHAWLDGEVPAREAATIEAHVASCAACAAAVAEARGLMAASSRILGALDEVPAGVTPTIAKVPTPGPVRARRPAWQRPQFAAAAATVIILAGSTVVFSRSNRTLQAPVAPTVAAEFSATRETPAPAPVAAAGKEEARAADRVRLDSPAASARQAAPAPTNDSTRPAVSAAVVAAEAKVSGRGVAPETTSVAEADVAKQRRAPLADAVVSTERQRLEGERRAQLAAAPPPATAAARSATPEKPVLNEVVATGASSAMTSRDASGGAGAALARCFDLQRNAAAVAAGVPAFVQLMELPGLTIGGRALRPVMSSAGAGWHWYRLMDGGLFLAHVVDGAIAYEVRFTGLGASEVVGTERACVTR